MQNIIAKYLMKNILVIFFALFFVFAFLVIGNFFTNILKSSLEQNLDIFSVLSLVFIKSLRDVPIIITLAFPIAIIAAIGKMYKDSEIYAITSTGIGEIGILQKIAPLIAIIAGLSFTIAMFLVPYSNIVKAKILQKNSNTSEFHFVKTKQFQKFKGDNIILYSSGNKQGGLGNIFIYSKDSGNKNIIIAENGSRYQDGANNVFVRLKNGAKYDGFFAKKNKKILDFETLDIKIFNKNNDNKIIKINANAKSLKELLANLNRNNISEIWWRISLPVAMLILSIIGIFLAKSPPRSSKNFGILYGIIIFAVYLNFLRSYKDKIVQSDDLIITMLLPHLIFIIIAIFLYFKNNGFKR